MKVYLNGKFVDASRARLSIFDASVQHAVGLFETMRAAHGRVFRLIPHVERLIASARLLGLSDRLRPGPLAEAVELTREKNNLAEARIRLTVTGGDHSLLTGKSRSKNGGHHPSIFITATEPTQYPEAMFTQGVPVVIADPKANPFDPAASHKTLNYWTRLQSLSAAAVARAGEALWFTVTNHLCGGSVSNAFIVKDGQLLTPFARGEEVSGALPSPVLPGITRAAVLEIAQAMDLPVQKKMLTINDVLEADELMLTNSSWHVLPVVRVEKETIGSGDVGPITQQIRERLLKTIEEECA
ncbi:MAG: hypothetical protein GC162_16985 [Planctomycetes bacterium]|nr:hypothetical protein [Planctomycetota bacterium]